MKKKLRIPWSLRNREKERVVNYLMADFYREFVLIQCEKCGNNVLHNDSDEDVAVTACPICGKRYYIPEGMIPGIKECLNVKAL
jgi:ribosomal protein S27E